MSYYVFKRSANSFEEMVRAKKITLRKGLTYEEARKFCQEWNKERNESQIRNGTKAEFERE